MHTLTSIEEVSRTKRRTEWDDGLTLMLNIYDVFEFDLRKGTVLDDDTYAELWKKLLTRGKKKALDLLTRSDRTRSELNNILKRNGYPERMISEITAYLDSYHYLDDRRYAGNYADYASGTLSKRALQEKLRLKGVSPEIIKEAVEEAHIDEEAQIKELLIKRCGGDLSKLKDRAFYEKQLRFLASRGYGYNMIRSVTDKEHDSLT